MGKTQRCCPRHVHKTPRHGHKRPVTRTNTMLCSHTPRQEYQHLVTSVKTSPRAQYHRHVCNARDLCAIPALACNTSSRAQYPSRVQHHRHVCHTLVMRVTLRSRELRPSRAAILVRITLSQCPVLHSHLLYQLRSFRCYVAHLRHPARISRQVLFRLHLRAGAIRIDHAEGNAAGRLQPILAL